jgi:arylsulfatase A-like enzyme
VTKFLLSALLLAAALVGLARRAPAGEAKPNVVYIVADDLGWKDVGFHGSDIQTPNLDRLAAGGARLEQFYAQPMCTPTRAALMTGRYPLRYGLQVAVIPSAGTYGLATDEWLLPQALGAAGYTTAIVGKWHLGHARREYWPRQRGFDYQYGPLLGEIDYFTQEAHGKRDWFRDNKPVNEKGYVTTLLGDDAVRLIRAHDPDKPLFLYLAFTAPHAPYQAPQPYLDRYRSIADPSRRAYAAMTTAMDDQIGRVLAALDERHLRDRTLVVFQSDNGGPRSAKVTGEVSTAGLTIPCDNGPYREGKATFYEGGTRVVALANWPGRIKPGTVVDQPIHVVDVYPTLAHLAGASLEKTKPLDGVDVWPTIADGQPSPRREVVYNVSPFGGAVRQGDWKLVWRASLPSQVELFDLAKDPSETTNLAAQNPEKVAELQKRIETLAGEAVPPLLVQEGMGTLMKTLSGSVSLPDEKELELQP